MPITVEKLGPSAELLNRLGKNMAKSRAFRILGEGALVFHATAVYPIWTEVSQGTDIHYPLMRNILLIVVFVSVPYIVCLLLSHRLYRQTQTNAPLFSCALSLAMFAGTLF